jgi:hypothetical protein
MGSVGDAPPGGPNVQTIGANVLHPRLMASPLVYGVLKIVVAAVGVATATASRRLFVDQLATRASAAASALGLSVVGRTTVLGFFAGGDVVVVLVVVGTAARAGCVSPE